MSRVMEEMIAQAVKEKRREIAANLLATGDSHEKIARVTKLSLEEVMELDKHRLRNNQQET